MAKARNALEQADKEGLNSALTPGATPACLVKLQSKIPTTREEGCLDIVSVLQNGGRTALASLIGGGVSNMLVELLCSPFGTLETEGTTAGEYDALHVHTAAATALRSLLFVVDSQSTRGIPSADHNNNTLPSASELLGTTINERLCQAVGTLCLSAHSKLICADSFVLLSNGSTMTEEQLASVRNGVRTVASTEEGGEASAFETLRDVLVLHLDETIQLVGILANTSDQATAYFSSTDSCAFLRMILTVLQVGLSVQLDESTRLQILGDAAPPQEFVVSIPEGGRLAATAAESMHLLASDNEVLGTFLNTGLSPTESQMLNQLISNAPTSPSLLVVSLHLATALLSAAPTLSNGKLMTTLLAKSIEVAPMSQWRRTLPLLTDGCTMNEDMRQMAVKQTVDRLRSLQMGCEAVSDVVGLICESHTGDADDEVEFARNPEAPLLLQSGVLSNLLVVVQDLLPAEPDLVASKALREITDNAEVSGVQSAFMNAEVAVLGLVSSLMHLLPVSALGHADALWRVCVTALHSRHRALSESGGLVEGERHPCHDALVLQLESLTEMCWTILRKDAESRAANVQPADLDLFTRIAWEGYASSQTVSFIVSVVGCIGLRTFTQESVQVCGRFCAAILNHALTRSGQVSGGKVEESEEIEVGAEAGNTLMDLFSEDTYNDSVYTPLGIQGVVLKFIPVLGNYIKGRFGKRRSPKKEHLCEIMENMEAFADYKRQHAKGSA
jgi:hypothetical protein